MSLSLWLVVIVAIAAAYYALGPKFRPKSTARGAVGDPSSQAPMNIPHDAQSAFIVCTFSMLGKLSAADGEVSDDERLRVERYIDDVLRLNPKTKKLALEVFDDAQDSPVDIRDYAQEFKKNYPDRVQLLDRMVEILLEVSAADGVLSPEEDEAMRSTALLLGLSPPGYERIKKNVLRPKHLH